MSPWRINGQFRFDGLFVVPALLNDKPFKLLFDPGAAFSTIKPSAAALLELPIRRARMRVLGMPIDAQSGLHGLLGMDFLRQYRFTLEPDTATLIMRPRRK